MGWLFEDSPEDLAKKKAAQGVVPASQHRPAPSLQSVADMPQNLADSTTTPAPARNINYTGFADDSNPVYQMLKAKVDVSSSPVFNQVALYMKPLEKVIPDEQTRFQAALAQAAAASPDLTPDRVLNVFNDLLQRLDAERTVFQQATEAKRQKDIVAKQGEMTQIDLDVAQFENKIAELKSRKASISNDIQAAQVKIDTTNRQFDQAYARRKAEIEEQKGKYATLLR